MLTTTTAKAMLQSLTKIPSDDTTNTSLLMSFWNQSRQTVAGIRGGNWPWLEIEETIDTVADQDYVYIPNNMRRITAVRAVVGTGSSATIYLPRLVHDEQKWQAILAQRLGTNQYPYFVFQRGQKLLMNPVPSVTGTHVILTGRRTITDNDIDDYSTGSVVSIANGATTLTGTGTTWTASMAGRWIRITKSDTANKGDGQWYEIGSVTSTTVLELLKPYQGTSISAGSAAYSLGQITYEPEQWQMAPIYRACALFFQINQPMQPEQANRYWRLYDGGQEMGLSQIPAGMIGQMLEEAGETFDGHYISPSRRGDDAAGIPYYFPWDLGTGF